MLLSVHLATNYRAVRCVVLTTLNRQRTNLTFSGFHETGRIPSPKEVSVLERVLERSGVLRWTSTRVGCADAGVRFATILHATAPAKGSSQHARKITDLARIFQNEEYLLDPQTYNLATGECGKIEIFFKESTTSRDQVKGWCHALWLATTSREKLQKRGPLSRDVMLAVTLAEVNECFENYWVGLQEAGWNVGSAGIEIRAGYRLRVLSEEDHETRELVSKKDL